MSVRMLDVCVIRGGQEMWDIMGAHTDTSTPHSLRSVASWTGAVVAASGVLTDLIVSALMSSISALINVCSRPEKDEAGAN